MALSAEKANPQPSAEQVGRMASSAGARKRVKCALKVYPDGSTRMVPRPRTHEENIEVFWMRVQKGKPDECWPWIGLKKENGNGLWYGVFWTGKRSVPAHRFSFELANGPIALGMLVCHRCDNPICVNPAHFFMGTYKDNNRDTFSKGRQKKSELRANAVLNPDKVRLIHKMKIEGLTQKKMAEILGCRDSVVQAVIDGRSWKHVV